MSKRFLGAGILLVLAGCGGNPEPEVAPTAYTRAQCDSFAARAIQTADLSAATSLAAQAAECYATLQGQSRR